jgi:hypothetical protein
MSDFATWSIPQGLSASKKDDVINRARHYRFIIPHYLKDGTRIIPNIDTVFSVIEAFDAFGDIPLVVSEGSYYAPNESQLEDLHDL